VDARVLREGATDHEALIGFVDEQGGVGPASAARFLMPAEWKHAAPMSYLRQHNRLLASVNTWARPPLALL
jgi:hypothetical protein